MLDARIIGHITYDSIMVKEEKGATSEYGSIGGPPVYSGLLLSNLGLKPYIDTRVGFDFDDSKVLWLSRRGIVFGNNIVSKSPTTKFRIEVDIRRRERTLFLISKCDEMKIDENESDICLLQPVIGEVDEEQIKKLRSLCDFLFVDPQGFLRSSENGKILLSENKRLVQVLKYVDAIKVDIDEGRLLTGMNDFLEIGKRLLGMGVREAIVTEAANHTYLFTQRNVYSLSLPHVTSYDAIGAGDMLGAGYTYARQKAEPEESLLFGVASAISRIEKKALEKIPSRGEIERMVKKMVNRITRIS